MKTLCLDMEGVLVPEMWISVAENTGIEELRVTTRELPDYDELMSRRIKILNDNNIKIGDIRKAVSVMEPLDGAREFLEWLKPRIPVIVLSDTFSQFAGPLLEKLGYPTIFCNDLIISDSGSVTGYRLRQNDGKTKAVEAIQGLNIKVIAVGDSFNDIGMLKQADKGFLFKPPENIRQEFKDIATVDNYKHLKDKLKEILRSA